MPLPRVRAGARFGKARRFFVSRVAAIPPLAHCYRIGIVEAQLTLIAAALHRVRAYLIKEKGPCKPVRARDLAVVFRFTQRSKAQEGPSTPIRSLPKKEVSLVHLAPA